MGNRTYYNEIDPFAAAWLRNLIKEKLIPDGDVDERSIADVQPVDLKDYAQCHFFAGIGGWSYALQLAGWPDDEPVWTGSCPCQPFSVAGRGKGTADERHLWPEFHRLIRECRPPIVFGEQVASKAGREWFAGVRADLEDVGYGAAAADLCAAGVGAPHIRQRLYWVGMANADSKLHDRRGDKRSGRRDEYSNRSSSCDVVNAEGVGRREGRPEHELRGGRPASASAGSGDVADTAGKQEYEEQQRPADNEAGRGSDSIGGCGVDNRQGDVANTDDEGRQGRNLLPERADELSPWSRGVEWRRGADGKERRVKSGVRLLVDGVPNRVGRLRGYGNAIVPQVAAEFIKACV